jgi:hypothetical protein
VLARDCDKRRLDEAVVLGKYFTLRCTGDNVCGECRLLAKWLAGKSKTCPQTFERWYGQASPFRATR